MALATSERRLARDIEDPVALRWTARMGFRLTVEGIIAWLEVGEESRDEAFLAALTAPISWSRKAAAIVAGDGETRT
jgi:hypothetical protein